MVQVLLKHFFFRTKSSLASDLSTFRKRKPRPQIFLIISASNAFFTLFFEYFSARTA